MASGHAWVSVAGYAEIVNDVEKTKELWDPGLTGWFPQGPENPNITLIRVHADSAEYWDMPGAITGSLQSFVKTHVTGKPYKIDNETVTL